MSPTTTPHTADRPRLRLCRETAWGVAPAEPVWQELPLVAGGYTVAATVEPFSPDTRFGAGCPGVVLPVRWSVRGGLEASLWPAAAALLLEAALGDGGLSPSVCAELYSPAGSRRHLGLRVARVALEAAASRSAVRLAADLVGRSEETAAGLSADDFADADPGVPFRPADATVTIAGEGVPGVSLLRLEADTAVQEGPARQGAVAWLEPGPRVVTLDLTCADVSDALRAAVRSGSPLAVSVAFAHPGSHALTLSLPAAVPVATEPHAAPRAVAETTCRLRAAADPGGVDLAWSLDLSA